jgi:tryptophan 2,3-dioxygenase
LNGLVELEQSMLVFRQRHARMVERVIGRRVGTGGSSGVDYLDRTALAYRVFADLWALRTFQIQPAANPAPLAPDFYAFRNG